MVASSARLLCYRQHNDNVMWTAATVALAAHEKVPSRGPYTVYNASIYHILHQLLHYMQRIIEKQACRLTTLVGRALLHNILSPSERLATNMFQPPSGRCCSLGIMKYSVNEHERTQNWQACMHKCIRC